MNLSLVFVFQLGPILAHLFGCFQDYFPGRTKFRPNYSPINTKQRTSKLCCLLMRRLQRTTSMEQKGRKCQHKVILCNNSCFEIAFQKLLFKDIIFYEVSTKKSKMIQGFINFPILVLSSVDDMKSSEESALDSNTLHQQSK